MKVLIENYRGWDIYFNTENEDFYTVSNEYDKENTKKSYASTKKFIDDYIKENMNFKPIKVMRDGGAFVSKTIITLIGLRKDGVFMIRDEKGNVSQLSKYSEPDYFEVNSENDSILKEISDLDLKRDEITNQIKEKRKGLKMVTVPEIRKRILGN